MAAYTSLTPKLRAERALCQTYIKPRVVRWNC